MGVDLREADRPDDGAPEPLIPDYGSSTLADLLPSVAAAQGVPGWQDVLQLPVGARWVVLLVDGLGHHNLQAAAEHAPFLAGHAGRTLTSGAPSTTATSISCLGTGLVPGQHGIVGYSFRNPVDGTSLNALTWAEGLSGLDVQPRLTMFERLTSAGVAVSSVSPARFAGSGLTEAALRGGRFWGVPDESDYDTRGEWAVQAACMGERTVVYVYERFLDHAGHSHGWRSPEWLAALQRVDAFAAALREALPDEVRLVVTGDHGMIDVPPDHRLVAEDEPGLLTDVTLLAGEGRLRQVYAEPRDVDAVARRWRRRLGQRAWVTRREEAVEAGWFGAVDRRMADRIGDVLVVLRSDWAVMTRTLPREFTLVGMHGSLTDAEMRVPLLVI